MNKYGVILDKKLCMHKSRAAGTLMNTIYSAIDDKGDGLSKFKLFNLDGYVRRCLLREICEQRCCF